MVIGTCFGLLGAAVAISPVGRRGGAHLNPAVTFAFFLPQHTSLRDTVGFAAAQTAGALAAGAGFVAALTCGLILAVFTMLSSVRTARWTPVAVVAVFTVETRERRILTAKPFHDARYVSVHASVPPVRRHLRSRPRAGCRPGPARTAGAA